MEARKRRFPSFIGGRGGSSSPFGHCHHDRPASNLEYSGRWPQSSCSRRQLRRLQWFPNGIGLNPGPLGCEEGKAKLKRSFQFRSVERDAQTDQLRIGPVVQAIDTAIGAALREREALRARVNAARDLASFAVGTGDDEYLTRETKDTCRIKEYEQQIIVGEKRLQDLDQQIASLGALQELSKRCFPEPRK
ncbi:MAG TPA: hypothetical protein VIK28_07605 [Sedimentisphaerales bacterium]